MKTLVVYYSRTGTTKKAAEIAAKELNADIEEIVDDIKRRGIWGYIKSGSHAIRKKLTKIEKLEKDAKDYDLIIIGSPVWANNMPPAIRTYLKNNNLENKKVAILITYGGSGEKSTAEEIKKLIKAEFIGEIMIKQMDMKESESKIKEWAKQLKA